MNIFETFVIFQVKASTVFLYLWTLFQPVLFGLIGAEVVFERIKAETVGLAIAVLAIGLVVRMAFTMLAVTGSGLNWKEKLFTAIAWVPKATVSNSFLVPIYRICQRVISF